METQQQMITPEVGMGVTQVCGSDRYAYTICEVTSKSCIVVQEDFTERADGNGMSDFQSYHYSPNSTAPEVVLTKRSNGKWAQKGHSSNHYRWLLGYRDAYYDYTK